MVSKTATIIPTNKPKFKYAYGLLESFINFVQQPHDLYFVFTDEEEAKSFKDGCEYTNLYKELILPDILRNRKSVVNVKKYFGLYSIHLNYDYVGVFDCESIFVKQCNLSEIYYDIASQNYLKANNATIGNDIIKDIAEKLKLNYNKKLLLETNFYSLYWWFNEIPVYRMDYFVEFINWFYSLENTIELQNYYYSFDFLVYSMWLICFKDFKIKEYNTPIEIDCGAVEDFRVDSNVRHKIIKTFNSYWSVDSNHKKYDKIKLLFQIDNLEEYRK
jgi:hypothetical protein